MAMKFCWNDATKLTKLVEDPADKALTSYSTLHENMSSEFQLGCKKFNTRFGPKGPGDMAEILLAVLQQNVDKIQRSL